MSAKVLIKPLWDENHHYYVVASATTPGMGAAVGRTRAAFNDSVAETLPTGTKGFIAYKNKPAVVHGRHP